MKSRSFVIIPILSSIIIVALVGIIALSMIRRTPDTAIDISRINEVTKNVEKRLNSNELEKYITNENVKVVMLGDSNYQDSVYYAIKNNLILNDIFIENEIVGKVIFLSETNKIAELKSNLNVILMITTLGLCGIIILAYINFYYRAVRPFTIMQKFASDVARGQLDMPMHMLKRNYFGAFTESFDLMRHELKRAKEAEYKANISKKELVASLSHDIKTPIATIKALCELLEIKLVNNQEIDKINIIEKKADVIDKLISNMLNATMDELERLKIDPQEEASTIITEMVNSINHYQLIEEENKIPECLIYCDRLRLEQVIDNIINNSYKYANTEIYIKYALEKDFLSIFIRDLGEGVSDEELALVFEKFYRGESAKGQSGSGLGLYLSKQFLEGMDGSIEAFSDNGFCINIKLKLV